MEKKSTGGISKSLLKSLNRTYVGEYVKDENRTVELLAIFLQGEYDKINQIINSNQVLNFKDSKGNTLIHCIIKNESPNLTPEIKLEIIKELVVRNISLNSMNELNQNALHLACMNGYGYINIINYLIEQNCNSTLIDNNGNAPVHYIINKFIIDCKQNDFYNESNLEKKSINTEKFKQMNLIVQTSTLNTITQILTQTEKTTMGTSMRMGMGTGTGTGTGTGMGTGMGMGMGMGTISTDSTIIPESKNILNNIPKIIEKLKIYYIKNIDEFVDKKKKEIETIFFNFESKNLKESEENKIEDVKSLIFKSKTELETIFNININDTVYNYDDFYNDILIKNQQNKDTTKKKILNNIEKISQELTNIMINIDSIEKIYYKTLFKWGAGIFYMKELFEKSNNGCKILYFDKKSNEIEESAKIFGNTNNSDNSDYFNNIYDKLFYDNDQYKTRYFNYFTLGTFLNILNIKNIEHEYLLTENKNFINDKFNRTKGIPYYVDDNDQYIFIPLLLIKPDKENNLNEADIKSIKKNLKNFNNSTNFLNEKIIFNTDQKIFKYTPIHNICTIITENIYNIINHIKNLLNFEEYLIKFNLFSNKFINENIISNINNLILLANFIKQIDIEEISNNVDDIKNKFSNIKLTQQFNFIDNINVLIDQTVPSVEFYDNFNNDKYIEQINQSYKTFSNIFTIISETTELINKYQSYKQFDNLINNCMGKSKNSITDTYSDNFKFDYNKNFPDSFDLYKLQYFTINDDPMYNNIYDQSINFDEYIKPKFDNIVKIIPYYNNYDTNIFYTSIDTIPYTQIDFIDDPDNTPNTKSELTYKDYDLNLILKKDEYKRGYNLLSEESEILDLLTDPDTGKTPYINTNEYEFNTNKNVIFDKQDDITLDIDNIDTSIILLNLNQILNLFLYLIYEKVITNNELKKIIINPDEEQILTANSVNYSFTLNLKDFDFKNLQSKNIMDTFNYIGENDALLDKYWVEYLKLFFKMRIDYKLNSEIFQIIDTIFEHFKKSKTIPSSKILSSSSSSSTLIDLEQQFKNFNSIINSGTTNISKLIQNYSNIILTQAQIINFIPNPIQFQYNKSKNKKIISNKNISKCINESEIDNLMKINFNYRILDLNGNTIINRLIDQFNVYGIEKVLEKSSILKTYKNSKGQLPLDYLYQLITNITYEYSESVFNSRIQNYSNTLKNMINEDKNFNSISLDNSEDMMTNIIKNTFYIFNEIMWLKLYDYKNEWVQSDKMNLMKIFNIKTESLLINTFTKTDNDEIILTTTSILTSKISTFKTSLTTEIDNIKLNIDELMREQCNNKSNGTKSLINIDNKIKELKNEQKKKESELTIFESIDNGDHGDKNKNITTYKNNLCKQIQIKTTIDKYTLINNTMIDLQKYNDLITELSNLYYKVIKLLNNNVTISNPSISNFLLLIINNKFDKTNSETECEYVKKYYSNIFDNIFSNYYDLDRYEDSEYNDLNYQIINLIKTNIIKVINIEIINLILTYIAQTYSKLNNTSIDSTITELFKKDNSIIESITIFLYTSMITKLDIKNPDKTSYQEIDILKKNIIDGIYYFFKLKENPEDTNELEKILNFNMFICDNTCYNCYEEINKILMDMKKISIYTKMINLLKIN